MKSQSAMEYLMTYGWAILVIAVVLGVLFDIGIFSLPNFGSSCIAQSGFLCTNPILANTGALSIMFGQDLGAPMTITGFACTNSSTAPSIFNTTFVYLQPGSEDHIMVPCPTTSSTLGTHFTGNIWIRYNAQGQQSLIEQVASFSATASTMQPLYAIEYDHFSGPSAEVSIINTLNYHVLLTEYNNFYANFVDFSINSPYAYISSFLRFDVFDMNSEQFINLNMPFSISAITMSPDAQHLYAASYIGNMIAVFDTNSNQFVGNIIIQPQNPLYIATSPNSSVIYVANQIGLYAINSQSGATLDSIYFSNYVTSGYQPAAMSISPNGQYLYLDFSYPIQKALSINTGTFAVYNAFANSACLGNIEFSSDSKYAFISTCAGFIFVINTTTTTALTGGSVGGSCASTPILSPNQNIAYFACSTSSGYGVGVLNLNTLSSGRVSINVIPIQGITSNIGGGAISPNGQYLYLVSNNNEIYVVSTSNYQLVDTIQNLNSVVSAAFAPI